MILLTFKALTYKAEWHNAAIHPPGNNHIVRQVLDKSDAISGRVQSLVRPPQGCAMPLGRLLLTVAWRNNQAVSNARINPPPDDITQATSPDTMLMKGKLRAVGFNELLGRANGLN
jgi:hypothetical protein